MSEAPNDPFSLLLERQRSKPQRERLHQLKDKFGLKDKDALWGVLAVLEAYVDEVHSRANALPPPPPRAAALHWLAASAAAAGQVTLLAIAFAVGQSTAATTAARAAWWSVPAGWMAFVLALPALLVVIWTGWRTRQSDPGVGWGLVTLGVIATCTSLGALVALTT